ncbi:MAG TPA: DUF5343 domain-containing protein [Acidimicrobiia bacterium]|nr:DUF5343 domain-containing protein [Acidimicrobiia bacterium]
MPLPDKGPAPYAPGHTVLAFINHVRNRGIPPTIDEEYVGRITEIGDPYARRTLRALEVLDLVEPETKTATPTLEKIKAEQTDMLQATLAEWFNEAYKPVLNFVSPSDDLDRITDGFRSYTPGGQRDGMVRLFLSLAHAAGMIDEIPNRPRGVSAKPKSDRPKNTKTKKTKETGREADKPHAPQVNPNGSAKDRYLDLLMGLAEKSDGAPDPELLDRIERVLGVPKQEVSP